MTKPTLKLFFSYICRQNKNGETMKIAIIGAGFGGMAAAYDLAKAGHEITIYEAEDHPAGLATGFKEPGWEWSVEKFYHHWFAGDSHMLELIDELGLSHKVLFPRPFTVMLHKGQWYPFDSILKAILFPGLGWGLNKLRFGLVGLYLRLTSNWRQFEKVTVDAWMRKWAGEKVYRLMWEPLVIGKFGENYYKQVNMAWMWARIKARTTRLGTFEGGFQHFADLFAQKLTGMGVDIQYSSRIRQISPQTGSGDLLIETGDSSRVFERVLVTTSPSSLAHLAPSLPGSYLEGLLALKSMAALVMVFSLKHQLSTQGYYWYNLPKNEGFPCLALVEHTNFVSPEHFGGEHILYMGDYLEPDHPNFQLSQDELLEKFMPGLKRINPDFEPDWINKTWLFSTKYAQPVPLVNHSANIPAIQTPLPGLYFASMSQVYPWDRGTNFAVEIGRRAARMMLEG
jgi:protoporphyrinogen oxidase